MVVQKFGGTSVADADAIRRVIAIVRAAHAREGAGPAVVVSAMSGVTDALLEIAAKAGAGQVADALARIQQVRERHVRAATELVGGGDHWQRAATHARPAPEQARQDGLEVPAAQPTRR